MNFLRLLSFLNVFPVTLTCIFHFFSLCVAQEEEIHSSLVKEHGGGGVSSTSFTVTMDMQPLYLAEIWYTYWGSKGKYQYHIWNESDQHSRSYAGAILR